MNTVNPSAAELLQALIRFDTTNPPGNETDCITFIRDLLNQHGIQTQIVTSPENRLNLIARIQGIGTASPLLMYGHADVVTTEGQQWQHAPFSGDLADSYIWGRGALDMKGGLTMMLSALLRAVQEGQPFPGDLLFVVVSDEETGGEHGAKYLVEHHADLFSGIRNAIGEFGGFTQYIGGKRFYPIQVAEKAPCKLRATIRGKGGHSASYIPDNTMQLLGAFLTRLNHQMQPVRITSVAEEFIASVAAQQGIALRTMLRSLLNPRLTDGIIQSLRHVQPQILDLVPLLRNTVNATIVHGGDSLNVVPEQVTVDLDARLLPGFTPEQVITELYSVIGMRDTVRIDVTKWQSVPTTQPDRTFFRLLADTLKRADPDGTPVPFLLNASTDGRHFARLGIQTYGFTPMKLPPDFNFSQTIHAANERIPVDALEFGAQCIHDALSRYGY